MMLSLCTRCKLIASDMDIKVVWIAFLFTKFFILKHWRMFCRELVAVRLATAAASVSAAAAAPHHCSAVLWSCLISSHLVSSRLLCSAVLCCALLCSVLPCSCVQVSKVVGPDVYFMGIIDYLQEWTWAKKVDGWMGG